MPDFLQNDFRDEDLDEIFNMLEASDSEEELTDVSRARSSVNIERDHTEEASRLFSDYCCALQTYPGHAFKQQFCILRSAFIEICIALQSKVDFFKRRKGVVSKAVWNHGSGEEISCSAAR